MCVVNGDSRCADRAGGRAARGEGVRYLAERFHVHYQRRDGADRGCRIVVSLYISIDE